MTAPDLRAAPEDVCDKVLREAGLACTGMSLDSKRQLVNLIARRDARRAKLRTKVLADLERPVAPTPRADSGPLWQLALRAPDGSRIDLGQCRAKTLQAAEQRVLSIRLGKTSLTQHIPEVVPVREVTP